MSVKSSKNVIVETISDAPRPDPPITIASIALKVHLHPQNHQNEIVAASVVYMQNIAIDSTIAQKGWNSPSTLRNFSLISKLDRQTWPTGLCVFLK